MVDSPPHDEETQIDAHVDDQGDEDAENELSLMDLADVVSSADGGFLFKMKLGTAGDSPEKDVFPLFGSVKKWVYILWSGPCEKWKVMSFDDEVHNIFDPEVDFRSTSLFLQDISCVYMELDPSTSFRIYKSTGEVLKCTPIPAERKISMAMADAIFASMQLQEIGNDESNREIIENLHDSYYEENFPMDEEGEDAVQEGEFGAGASNSVVILRDEEGVILGGGDHAAEDDPHHDLEAGHRARGMSTSSQVTAKSANVEYHAVYGNRHTNDQKAKACCTVC